ncbi:MAG: tRNA lysidine(34) synthetase TilS [Gemmatimonadota bacterium]|nr:tRNA lysidine(34) synthetase TilS [Gemmatimonadota bacterium]
MGRCPTTEGHAPGVDRPIIDRLREFLEIDPTLLPFRSHLVVGVSGGSDSLALLHLLADLAPEREFVLHVAHYDHAVADDSADAAERVRGHADRLALPCSVERSEEELAGQLAYRRARFAFLDRLADRIAADRIVLAHQADDQIETVLLRLARGTGLRGLRGIPARRGRIVRPLVGFGRAELREYLTGCGVEWHEDPGNIDIGYARARVRGGLLPALRTVADVDRTLSGLTAAADRADRAMDVTVVRKTSRALDVSASACDTDSRGVQIARSAVAEYDRAEIARLLRILARDMGFRLTRGGTRAGVEFIRHGLSGRWIDMGGGLRLSREYDWVRLARVPRDRTDAHLLIETASEGDGTATLGGCVYEVAWGRPTDECGDSLELDPGRVKFPLRFRAPQPGDRIRTKAGSRKLKKLLNERRIPVSGRRRVPVLESADGRILWIAGHAMASGLRTPGSGGSFTIELRRAGGREP